MNVKRALFLGALVVVALGAVEGLTLYGSSAPPSLLGAPGHARTSSGGISPRVAGFHAVNVAHHLLQKALMPPRRPDIPLQVRQIGGLEPVSRVLAAGAWLNATGFAVTLRMSSPMAFAHLQPQIELRRAGVPFTGRPTASGAIVTYRGSPVLGVVYIRRLRNGVAYHWRVRVHDVRGPTSPWTSLRGSAGTAIRVYLAPPPAPGVTLATPAQSGGWVATRYLALRWTPPADGSGIRGYSYTLSRSPLVRPGLHWRTWLTRARVRARGNGLWYFTVRALNNAHTWGPPARLAVYVDTTMPRLRVLSAPAGPTNPRRVHGLLRLALTSWSRVTVDIVAAHGRVLRSIRTHLHSPGFRMAINWDGLGARGRRIPNGRYTLRITATNRAGLTWHTTRPLVLEGIPPSFVSYGLAQTGTYNPYNNAIDGPEAITLTLDAPARVRIDALHGSRVRRTWWLTEVHAGDVITATWDGTTADGPTAPGGLYTFRAVAVDAAGNRTTADLGGVVLDHRRIVVSLQAQRLWALDGNRVLLTSLVTTGGPLLPTPVGDYQIIDRESPFTFHSLYPPGSPLWYPDSPANFALLFDPNGYFIHDAPWRSYYGPGSNVVAGTPGQDTTGTHGCVNVPYYPMAWLFNWATMYTPVQIDNQFTP